MKPNIKRTKLVHSAKWYGFDLISKRPTQEELSSWGISDFSMRNMDDSEVYECILKYVKKYFEFDVPDGYIEDYELSSDGFFTREVITPERVAMVYMSLMRKESYEDINHFLHDIKVPNKGHFRVLPIYAKDSSNNPRYMGAGCLAFGGNMISARADVVSDFDDFRHAAWCQEYCIELGVRAFALKVKKVIGRNCSHVLDAAVVAYHAWKSEYSMDETLAWQDDYYTDIKAFYKKYAPIKGEKAVFEELKRGDRGDNVVSMQRALGGLVADGIFGRNTEKALKIFQKKCGLSQTGILDSVTYKMLYKEEVAPKKIKIALDDGHGANTQGKRTPDLLEDLYINGKLAKRKGEHIKENEFNDAVCNLLEKSLTRCGFDTFRSAPENDDVSLSDRKRRIRDASCDFSISIHYNASSNDGGFDSANGISGKVDNDTPTGFAIDIVQDILNGIAQIKGQRIRGLDEADLAMTNDDALGCPSCLIECGFMTNLTEMQYMLDTEYQKCVAEAITKALCTAYGMEYKEPEDIDIPQVSADLSKVKEKLQSVIYELNDLLNNL